jgi:hypothetical protein
MKINELIFEDDKIDISKTPIATMGDRQLTVGDIQNLGVDVDPQTIIKHASTINDFLQQNGETVTNVAALVPLLRNLRGAAGVGAIAKSEITRQAGKEIGKNVDILPTMQSDKDTTKVRQSALTTKKQRRYNVGDMIKVSIGGKLVQVPIKNILSSGYEVDVSKIPGQKPGQTMTVPEPTEPT